MMVTVAELGVSKELLTDHGDQLVFGGWEKEEG